MTESKVRSYVISKLRTIQNWTDEHKLARQRAKVGPNLFQCAKCSGTFRRDETHVDHRIPVIDPTVGFVDWNTYMVRLFCSVDNLQILCVKDHAEKTIAENELREKHGTGRFSAASRAKLSRALIGNKCANGPKSEAHKAAMSADRRGKPQTLARTIAIAKMREKLAEKLKGDQNVR